MNQHKILILTDRVLSDYTALALSFKRAFEKIGNPVESLNFEVNVKIYHLIYVLLPWFNDRFLRSAQKTVLEGIAQSECEVVLVVKGTFILPQTIEDIKAMNKRVFCFNPDDPFNMDFGASNVNIRTCIPLYSGYFTWSHRLVKKFTDMGCKDVFYMPFALDEDLIKAVPAEEDGVIVQDIDVSFIGGGDAKRIKLIKEIVKRLDKKVRFEVYGHDWQEMKGVELYPTVQGDEYLNVMYRSKINLNILRDQNVGSHNMRTFEIPGSKCFMLHENSEEAKGFFTEGVEADFYKNADECAEKIGYYLDDETRRLSIAESGYDKVYTTGYFYHNLIEKMLARFQNTPV